MSKFKSKSVAVSIEIQDISSLSQEAYLELCDVLFRGWNRFKSKKANKHKAYARKLRGLLTNLHQLYAASQACPKYYAELILELADYHLIQMINTKEQ